jgi:hypothetical protein
VESRDVPHDVIVANVVEALARWLGCDTKQAAAKGRGEV